MGGREVVSTGAERGPAPRDAPSEEQVSLFSKVLGSDLGETLRRNHGATWGCVTSDGRELPGMKTEQGSTCWPWGRARDRLVEGPESSLLHTYAYLAGQSP